MMCRKMFFPAFVLSICMAQHLPAQTPVTGAALRQLNEEKEDDPYLPNTEHLAQPAYHYTNAAERGEGQTIIYTNQVNIDAEGNDMLNDAGNEPSIAVNPLNPDQIVIGWRQFDNIASNFRQAGWSYTTDGGTTWTFPGRIEEGIFRSDPVLDFTADGTFYYNSLSVTPDFVCKVFASDDGGASWNSGTDAGGGDKQWMTVDRSGGVGDGNIYAFWTLAYSSCLPGSFIRSEDENTSYDDCTGLPGDPYFGTLDVDVHGDLYIAGISDDYSGFILLHSANAQEEGSDIVWDDPVPVDLQGTITGWNSVNPEGLFGQTNIAIDRSGTFLTGGNIYILASVQPYGSFDGADVMFARSTDGGLSFEPAIRINDDPSDENVQWLGTMSVAPNGRIDIVWLDTRDSPGSDNSALYYSYSMDGGETFSANEKLSDIFDPHVGYPSQNKMGDYFDMVSDDTGAHLAWANTLNGGEDVYHSYIIPYTEPTVGITQHIQSSVFVYPDPNDGICTISGMVPGSRMHVYAATGQCIYSSATTDETETMDLRDAADGLYLIEVVSPDGKVTTCKMVKRQW
ncbi:MAG: sialidase family protein [Chitinophagales bacterium]